MSNVWKGSSNSAEKSVALADIINSTLEEIGGRCLRGSKISRRCDLAVIGYESSSIRSAWGGSLAGRDIVGVDEVVANPLREEEVTVKVPDGGGGLVEVRQKRPVWIEPKTGGSTPTAVALRKAYDMADSWIREPAHQNSFPPMVFHITDGIADDPAAAVQEASRLRSLATTDGNVLLVSVHLPDGYGYPMLYPVSQADLPPNAADAQMLFEMSSVLPNEMLEQAMGAQLPVKPGCKMMIANADPVSVISLISWATVGTLGRNDPAGQAVTGGLSVSDLETTTP